MLYSIRTITTFIASDFHMKLSGLKPEPLDGSVHSSYKKAINLRLGCGLAALQPAGSPVSPISLITELSPEHFSGLAVTKGQPVLLFPDTLCIRTLSEDMYFSFSDAQISESALHPGCQDPSDLSNILGAVLTQPGPGMFTEILFPDCPSESTDDFLFVSAAGNILKEASSLYAFRNYPEAASALTRLIGLGQGLTPAGDDFLCGVLACHILTGKTNTPFFCALKKEICLNINRTNDLSAAFLQCAVRGHFSESVQLLPSCKNPDEIMALFRKIGHSSGMDTLCGIFYGTTLLLQN